MRKPLDGVRSVEITIVSDNAEANSLKIIEDLPKFIEQSLSVTHKVIMEGYRNEST